MIFDELVRCRAWIEGALEHSDGTHLFDDVAAGIYAGRFHFWPLERGCLVTEFNVYPRRKMLNTFLAGGDLEEIRAFVPTIEAFARSHGCDALQCSGRRGWARALIDVDEKAPIYRRAVTEKEL